MSLLTGSAASTDAIAAARDAPSHACLASASADAASSDRFRQRAPSASARSACVSPPAMHSPWWTP